MFASVVSDASAQNSQMDNYINAMNKAWGAKIAAQTTCGPSGCGVSPSLVFSDTLLAEQARIENQQFEQQLLAEKTILEHRYPPRVEIQIQQETGSLRPLLDALVKEAESKK